MRGPRHTRPRIELLLVAALSLAWCVVIAFHVGSVSSVQRISNLGLVVAPLYAAVAAAQRACREQSRRRAAWCFLSASALSWSLGMAAWTTYETFLGREVPFPSYADLGYLTAVPLLLIGLCLLPQAPLSSTSMLRSVLDGIIIAAALLIVSWELVLAETIASGTGSWFTQAIGLAYPGADVVLATLALILLVRVRHGTHLRFVSLLLLSGSVLSSAVADSGFAFLTLAGSYFSGHPIDAGWFLGYLMMAAAARTADVSAETLYAETERRIQVGVLAPYVAVVLALAAAVYRQVTLGRLGGFMVWSLLALLCCLVIRQVLTMRENLVLTVFLEARVEERTVALAEREQWFRSLVQNSSDVVTVVDEDGTVRYQTPSAQRVFGHDPGETLGRSISSYMDRDDASRVLGTLRDAARISGSEVTVEARMRDSFGRWRETESTITSLVGDPHVRGLVVNTRDVSERKALENALAHQAFHDGLTGLANRALFRDRLEHALESHLRSSAPLAVLFLDLDCFKAINDSLGHAAGDRLLSQVGSRLAACVRPGDTVARLGGDEFAVLLSRMDHELDAEDVAGRLSTALLDPFVLDGAEVLVRASVGIAAANTGDETADVLLRNADVAMYHAKALGGARAQRFEPSMHAALVGRLEMENDLRHALDHGELVLYYQPTVDLEAGTLIGLEALVRWQHPTKGLVLPGEFITVAEETGLIVELGAWVLNEACRRSVGWQSAHPGLTVAVNISGRQLIHGSLLATVERALTESGLAPECLILEMTESILIEHTDQMIALLNDLKALGVGLAVDDFGTGYSSLSYLGRFPVDILKIDRSFVERIALQSKEAELASTIISLGRSLQLKTVAEGIETAEQLSVLQGLGCARGQGFLFSQAVAAEKIDALLYPGVASPSDRQRLRRTRTSGSRPDHPNRPASKPAPTGARSSSQ